MKWKFIVWKKSCPYKQAQIFNESFKSSCFPANSKRTFWARVTKIWLKSPVKSILQLITMSPSFTTIHILMMNKHHNRQYSTSGILRSYEANKKTNIASVVLDKTTQGRSPRVAEAVILL